MNFVEVLKVLLFGIVEGFTEWLPISSTGHLILVEQLVQLDQPESFWNVFKVVIQLGAILAVVLIYWEKLWPFSRSNTSARKRGIISLWLKIAAACVPTALIGLPLDMVLDDYLSSPVIIAAALIVYGVIFIVLENRNKNVIFPINSMKKLDYKTAVLIGLFQCLAFIPGTSRSGATILGAMILGCARPIAAEFSFYLGIPVMFGASLLKIVKHGFDFTGVQIFLLLFGMMTSFIVAVYTIRFLMKYIRKHDFKVFGYYRIVLGIIVLIYFLVLAR
ncbi:MAG: undecaprenyl-diphosphate phosphatase [Lachnospiraceae bacterium]|nr:undecaprenyl-diphosphate phosphatase [Lachnospiraceae bacterium]